MPDDLDAAVAAYQQAQAEVGTAQDDARQLIADARARVEQARSELAAAIVRAARAGVRQKEIVVRTGYTRESIRRICRAGGVESSSDDD